MVAPRKSVKKTPKKNTGAKPRSVKSKKQTTPARARLVLKKIHTNPVIAPKGENWWEGWQTFNPGVILLDDNIHFLYRAIGNDGMSRLGYARSSDGFHISERLPQPVYEHQVRRCSYNVYSYFSGGSWGGAEDPRIVRVGIDDVLYMTYTACNGDLRVGLTSIGVDDFLNKKWNWKPPVMISPPGEVHKNWVIFPEKINGKYAILHSINPSISVEYLDSLDFEDDQCIKSSHGGKPRANCWDRWVRGIGPVPLKTEHGWLVFYHAMDNDWSKYKVGAMLLDLNDPTKILYRSKEPILVPSEDYENNGFKAGVVYASGAVIKDGTLFVYYGGADSNVCMAYAGIDEFLDALIKHKEPKLRIASARK